MTAGKAALVEVFRSVQGEGYNAGRPAIFVRFAGCNLSCVFAEGALCDTPYQKARIKVSLDVLFDELIRPLAEWECLSVQRRPIPAELREMASWAGGMRDRQNQLMLILTGGEPTAAPQFTQVAKRAHREGFYVAVETNGTRWRTGLAFCDWISCSPKDGVEQGSPSTFHNPTPQDSALDLRVAQYLGVRQRVADEYRYVIAGAREKVPPWLPAFRHYVSPAALADGEGLEWSTGFPGFVPGALERCLEIVQDDPRWRISVQQHKLWRVP